MNKWPPPETLHEVIACIDGYWIEMTKPTYRASDWTDATPISLASHGCGCCGEADPTPTHWIPIPDETI